ncbi:MAG: hypothetical protein PVI13_12120, partial [Desulfobacterales bacterium]
QRKKKADDVDETLMMSSTDYRRMMAKSNPNKSINVVKFWDKGQHRGTVRDIEPHNDEHKSKTPAAGGVLTYLSGGSGRVELTRMITTIGKDPSSDIVIKGLLVDPTTATIKKEPDGCYLNYIGGLTKPKINEKPVTESTLLKDQDIIEVSSVKLQFSESPSPD